MQKWSVLSDEAKPTRSFEFCTTPPHCGFVWHTHLARGAGAGALRAVGGARALVELYRRISEILSLGWLLRPGGYDALVAQ